MIKNKTAKPRVRDDVPWPPVDLGSRLHHLRMDTVHNNHQALSQEVICDALSSMLDKSISNRKYSEWENNTKEPSLTEIACLAKLYNTTCDYLLTGTETDHVDASRKYGLSNEALSVLEYLNHRLVVHKESLLTDMILKKIRGKDTEKQIYKAMHFLAFINALLTSPLLPEIAIDFTNHVFNKEYVPAIYELIEDQKPAQEAFDVYREFSTVHQIIDKIYAEYPHLGNYRFEKVDPKERLKMDEYHLNKKWSQLFKSLLGNIDIIRYGISETNSIPDPLKKLSDDDFDQLDWPYK